MSLLVVSDDELGLLRFTCDLYFVEESPLYYLEEAQKEPVDYDGAYRSLVEKSVLDPRGFRLTDEALNRIAPITECDGRVVHIHTDNTGRIQENNYYLLDEIAVHYLRGDVGHAFGMDLDKDELIEHLARRFVPRRSVGDMLDVAMTNVEFLAFAQLARPGRRDETIKVGLHDARTRLGPAPSRDLLSATGPSVLSMLSARAAGGRAPRPSSSGLIGDPTWDEAVDGLLALGVFRLEDEKLVLRPALHDVVKSLARRERHTFVRYDFGEGEWFTRETTLLPTEGGLFFLGQTDDGRMRLRELDGDGLRDALTIALGPLVVRETEDDERPAYLQQYNEVPPPYDDDGDTDVMTMPGSSS